MSIRTKIGIALASVGAVVVAILASPAAQAMTYN
jgi:hypothetical protein